jgi:4-amino-4-deoxy-L-arabinose transferase-like glycosyltransferase
MPCSNRAVVAPLAVRPLVVLGGVFVLLQLGSSLNSAYGYFIDEFYYLSCAARPALGYVDHPPLAVWLLAGIRPVLGSSIFALRLLPALAGGLTVVLTGLLAQRLGAGSKGQVLAALAAALCPGLLAMHGFYSMNGFSPLIWTAAVLVLVEIAASGNRKLWLWFGLIAGVGLLNKHTFVTFGFAVLVGVVLSRSRRDLATRWPWLAGLLAVLIVMPNLVWELQSGWPSLEFYRNAALQKNVATPAMTILMDQIGSANMGALPLWGMGLFALLLSRRFRPFRSLGWIYLILLALMIVSQQARSDRMLGIYPLMFAAGAAWWEHRARSWPIYALGALVGLFGVISALTILPILPPAQLAGYAQALGATRQKEAGAGKVSPLPQLLADRFAWQSYVDQVVEVVSSLEPEELEHAAILTPSYGHAGALELLGPEHLPPVISGHNNWHLWGLPEQPIEVLVSVGYGASTLGSMFERVEQVDATACTYCMAWRDGLPIMVSRGVKVPIREKWTDLKHYE